MTNDRLLKWNNPAIFVNVESCKMQMIACNLEILRAMSTKYSTFQLLAPYIVGFAATMSVGMLTGNIVIAAKVGVSSACKVAVAMGSGALKGASGFAAKKITCNCIAKEQIFDGIVVGSLGGLVGEVAESSFHIKTFIAHNGGSLLARSANHVNHDELVHNELIKH